MPEISVIIALYDKAKYIERAIRSIQIQSIKDIEIIVIDDGSTDNGPDIVRNIKDDRISLFRQENMGVSKARNNGVKKSTSDFISFLDADDTWTEIHLETLLRLRKKFPQAGAYATTYIKRKKNNKIKKEYYSFIPSPPWEGILPNYFKSGMEGANPIATGVVGIPKKIFLEFGGFDEKARVGEDLDLWAKIALKYPIAFSWDVGTIYHVGADKRLSSNLHPIQYHPLIINGKKAIKNNEVPKEVLPYFREYIAKKEIQVVTRYILLGDMKTARKLINQVETKRFFFDKLKCKIYSRFPSQIYKFIHRWRFILRPLSISS